MKKIVSQAASKWDAQPYSADRSTPMFLRPLYGTMRRFQRTIAHTVVSECCKFPHRIVATYKTRFPQRGVSIPCDPRQIPLSIEFELACSDGIQKLSRELAFFGPLDVQLYARGFREGAEYLLSSIRACTSTDSEGSQVAAEASR